MQYVQGGCCVNSSCSIRSHWLDRRPVPALVKTAIRCASLADALYEPCFHYAATWRLLASVKILHITNAKAFRDDLCISRACCFCSEEIFHGDVSA